MSKSSLANLLAFSGTIPFVMPIVLNALNVDVLGLGLDYQRIVFTYAAIIASFMAGIHWAFAMQDNHSLRLFIECNVVALSAWFALLWYSPHSLLIFIACFVFLLAIDLRLVKAGLLEDWYISMRKKITIIVVVSLFGFWVPFLI